MPDLNLYNLNMSNSYYIDNQLYLDFLQISESDIPLKSDSNIDKQLLFKIVEQNFRKLARQYHPDNGGNEKDFQFLLECKNKILDTNTFDKNIVLQVNDTGFLSFDKNSMASQIGNQIFDLLSEWSEELNIKPMYKPQESYDDYEWIFYSYDLDDQICLNVQNLTSDLAELSHELYKDDSLSVLVCLFIPTRRLSSTKVSYDNSLLLTFNDTIFIESSKGSDIAKYFQSYHQMKEDLQKIKDGTFVSKQNNELKIKSRDEVIRKDRQLIEKLANLKLFHTEFNPNAADFIDTL